MTAPERVINIHWPHREPFTEAELEAWVPQILAAVNEQHVRDGVLAGYKVAFGDTKPLIRKRIIRDAAGLIVAMEEEPMP